MKTKKREFYVGVRLSIGELAALKQIAEAEDLSESETFRLILRNETRLRQGIQVLIEKPPKEEE